MAYVSKVKDKNGVVCDISAKKMNGTRKFQLTGSIIGEVSTDLNGESPSIVIDTTIADDAVQTSDIVDGAVTTSKINDKAVTLQKLSTEVQDRLSEVEDKQDALPTGGDASDTYAINISGNAVTATSATNATNATNDGSGQNIATTYATKTEVNGKMSVTEVTVSSESPVDLHSYRTIGLYNFTSSSTTMFTDAPVKPETGAAMTGNNASMFVSVSRGRVHQLLQYSDADGKSCWFVRSLYGSTVTDWQPIILGRNIRKSNDVSSFPNDDAQAYTGKAIAEYVAGAIGGNVGGYMGGCSKADIYTSTTNFHDFKMGDWFVASEAGTYTYRVDGTNKTIANVTIGAEIYFTTDKTLEVKPTTAYELTANRSTTIDSSTTKYPTNSAVKTYVDDGIANLSSTYATKTEVDGKSNMAGVLLNDSGSILSQLKAATGGNTVKGGICNFYFADGSKPTDIPSDFGTGGGYGLYERGVSGQSKITLYANNKFGGFWVSEAESPLTWKFSYYESRDSVEAASTSETKQAVSSKAVRNYVASATVAQANKVTVNERINLAIPLVADGGSSGLRDSWAYQYHDSSNGAILCVGDWNESVTEKAQLRLKKGSYSATIKNDPITESRSYLLPDKSGTILINSDVVDTYSSTGTAPVNGKAIKAALDAGNFATKTELETKVFECTYDPDDESLTFDNFVFNTKS